MFCGDLISSAGGVHKHLLRQGRNGEEALSSPAILAEASHWQENPSGGPECVSVKTGTLSRKSVVNL